MSESECMCVCVGSRFGSSCTVTTVSGFKSVCVFVCVLLSE